MKDNLIITIGREFCSGGAEIAKKVAEHFDIPYYDKAIIDKTANNMGFEPEIIEKHDEQPMKYWDISGYHYGTSWYFDDPSLLLPIGMRIANEQFKVINDLADKGSCVIVGRCADYVLEDRENVINIFIKAPLDKRIKRAEKVYNIDETKAKKLIKKTDKIRASYYSNYTHTKWGGEHYDLVIESDAENIDEVVNKIIDFVNEVK